MRSRILPAAALVRAIGKTSFGCVLVAASYLAIAVAAGAPAAGQECVGDCDGDGVVRIPELLTVVNIALSRLPISACVPGDPNGNDAIAVNELVRAVAAALQGCVPPPTPTSSTVDPTHTTTPTADTTQSATSAPSVTSTASASPTSTDAITATPSATSTSSPTPTTSPTPTPTSTAPPPPTAPPDANFNDPLNIQLDSTGSVTDFVSFPGGDTQDRVRWDVLGMNPNPSLPGGRARLILAVSCFGNGTNNLDFFTGGQTFACGETIVDREVTFDSKTGTVVITAVGGDATYVQWVLTGTATRVI